MKKSDREILAQIAAFEEATDRERDWPGGWCWRQVKVWPGTLNRLCLEGYLETLRQSNRYTGYRLTDLGRALASGEAPGPSPQVSATGETGEGAPPPPPAAEEPATPPSPAAEALFQDIVGHAEVKELLRAALDAERPVHVLLAGPPALAKSLFLWDIESAYGQEALWLLGLATSRAGLFDLVAQRQPRVLLIDELDKMPAADTAGLLSLMEGGRVVRAKVRRALDKTVPLRVVAATNHLEKLSPELRSRFAVRTLQPYSREEFRRVVREVLVRREETPAEVAEEIARRLEGRTQDVREAARVARLAPRIGVERAVQLLLGGAPS